MSIILQLAENRIPADYIQIITFCISFVVWKNISVEVRSFDLIFQHFSLQSGGALNYSFIHIKPINVLSVMQ